MLVNGADAGREGEAIFRYVYNFLGCHKPFKRLWTSSLTETALRNAFGDLKPSADYDNLYLAARCRNEADWLVGMNATRAISIANGSTLTLGRVQTPTLAMVCSRYLEAKNFTPTPYYVVKLNLTSSDGTHFFLTVPEHFADKKQAQELVASLPKILSVIEKKESEVQEKAPLPFNIDAVQIRANQLYGFKAKQTLDCVQSLYESKMVTYPRTGSRYLGDDMISQVATGVKKLAVLSYTPAYSKACSSIDEKNINKAMFDTNKLTDHHAIIPTFENILTQTSADCKKIYDLIATQIVAASMPPCIKKRLSYGFHLPNGQILHVTGYTIKDEGWRAVLKSTDETDKEEDNQKLPAMTDGEQCSIDKIEIIDKMTTAPPLLTEASLLKLMETAGRLIDSEEKELQLAIKECGIGTPATRAAAIERLYKNDYVRLDGKKIIPTDKGLDLFAIVKSEDIAKVEMTAEWEEKLQQIEEGKFSPSTFLSEISEYTRDVTTAMLSVDASAIRRNEAPKVGKCPLCGADVVEKANSYSCIKHRKDNSECDFWIPKKFTSSVGAKPIPLKKKDCINLINGKETSEYQVTIKGIKKAKKLRYDKELKRIRYVEPMQRETELVCPKCGGKIIETDKSFRCENNDFRNQDSCPVSFYKQIFGADLTEDLLKTLLAGEKTKKLKLKSKLGKEYEAQLYYNKESNNIELVRNQRETELVCPKCGGKIIETDKQYRCEHYRYNDSSACQFAIWNTVFGVPISEETLKELLEKGETTEGFEFKTKDGKKQTNRLKLTGNKVEKI